MNRHDNSVALGELRTVPTAALEPSAMNRRTLSFSYHSNQGRFRKEFTEAPRMLPEDLWEYIELQEHVPIRVTAQDDMEWWWFQGEFYQTRFVEGCPSRCLRQQLTHEPGIKAASLKWKNCVEYSLNTAHEVEAFLWAEDIEDAQVDQKADLAALGVDWEIKLTLDASGYEDGRVGYSPTEVAHAVFELSGEQESRAQKWKRLQAFQAVLDRQKEQHRLEMDRWIQGRRTIRSKTRTSKQPREPIPKSVKIYVWQRDGGRCVECGSKEKLEYDHIIPLSKGGSNTDRNIQLLCEHCNRSKSNSIA